MPNAPLPPLPKDVEPQTLEAAVDSLKARVAREATQPVHLMFVAFAEEGRSLGGILVHAHGPVDALMQVFERELYPGGEAAFMDAPKGETAPESEMYKLLLRADLKRIFGHVYDGEGNELDV